MAPALENLATAVSKLRHDHEIPTMSDEDWHGGQCRVYKASFVDGQSWCIRTPLRVSSDGRNAILGLMEVESVKIKEVSDSGFPYVPKHHGSSLTFDNDFGLPFIALSWIEGRQLCWNDTTPPGPMRKKVLCELANIQVKLIEHTKIPGHGAERFFSRLIANKVQRVNAQKLEGLSIQDCERQKELLSTILIPQLRQMPFAIDHGDLAAQNIIVDQDYNICGIIDWGFAAMVPLELSGRLPRLLQLQDLTRPPSAIMQQDRNIFVAHLRSHSSEAAQWILLMCSGPDVDFRHAFVESLVSKGMHQILATLGWSLPWSENQGGL